MTIDMLLLDTPFGQPCPWWWIWSLGAFLLGLLVACFVFGWCRYGRRIRELEEERDNYHAQFTAKEKDYMSLKYQFDESNKDNTALRASLNKCESDMLVLKTKMDKLSDGGSSGPVGRGIGVISGGGGEDDTQLEAESGGLPYGGIFESDNLKIVEGVGPKIESLLKAAGFNTWAALGKAEYEDLKKVLEDAGPRYRIHDPKSWAQQAQLAADGKWSELVEFQKFLDAGREDKGDFATPSKVEKMAMKILGFSNNPEDLKIVEGIGPKIEGLLKAAGINTWQELSEASTEKLQGILNDAGDRYRLADPSTWAKQAGLAAAGKWGELTEYQEYLSGGKDPGKS